MARQIVFSGAILFWMTAGMICTRDVVANDSGSVYSAVETYRQELIVEVETPANAPRSAGLAAVYEGRKWGLSTRWDDSNPNALNVRRKMLENGIRGTFYLNSRNPETQQGSLAQQLTGQGECSVGGHSVTHPHLLQLPANEVFYELMANRIALECLTDRPVNSLAFPYGGYQDNDRPEVLQGVTEAVLRTGYHHCVYSGFVTRNQHLPANLVSTGLQVVPGDRQVDAGNFWKQIEKVRENEEQSRKTSDCIFLGVHPWQEGEELDRLGEVMGKLDGWDDFWHCTQTEYAAFVKQRRNTTVEMLSPGRFALVRPCAFDLGSEIPLTLVFEGDSVRGATVDGQVCTLRRAEGRTFVNVPHSSGRGVPARIDETSDGAAAKFPGLSASLSFEPETGKVCYHLENKSAASLSDLRLTVSTPPAFEPGVLRSDREELAEQMQWTVDAAVASDRSAPYWHEGRHYVAAQLDFLLDGRRGRLFTTCREPAEGE